MSLDKQEFITLHFHFGFKERSKAIISKFRTPWPSGLKIYTRVDPGTLLSTKLSINNSSSPPMFITLRRKDPPKHRKSWSRCILTWNLRENGTKNSSVGTLTNPTSLLKNTPINLSYKIRPWPHSKPKLLIPSARLLTATVSTSQLLRCVWRCWSWISRLIIFVWRTGSNGISMICRIALRISRFNWLSNFWV